MQTQNANESSDYYPINIKSISVDAVYQFDLYQESNGSFRLFRHQDISISQKDIDNLKKYDQEILYVPAEQKEQLNDYMIDKLPNILKDKSVPIEDRIDILTDTSASILDRVLTKPTKNNIRGSVEQSNNHVYMALHEDSAQQLMTIDYSNTSYPIAHSISVANMSIILGIQCGITSPKILQDICIGALLHEIGKRIIDKNCYCQQNNNSHSTNTRLRQYPLVGKSMLAKTGVVPDGALRPILEHQERLDGSGYPYGLKASEIGIEGRIVAICDCYDEALRTNKSKTNNKPFHILMEMRKAIVKYDKNIFTKFIHLLGSDIASNAIKN